MSPFSNYLHRLRLRHQVRQVELAEHIGCDQTYISALETGSKGPPTPDFIDKLTSVLQLSEQEQQELSEAVAASQRKFVIPLDTPEEMYRLLEDLREEWNDLTPERIQLIRGILKMRAPSERKPLEHIRRLRRRDREVAAM